MKSKTSDAPSRVAEKTLPGARERERVDCNGRQDIQSTWLQRVTWRNRVARLDRKPARRENHRALPPIYDSARHYETTRDTRTIDDTIVPDETPEITTFLPEPRKFVLLRTTRQRERGGEEKERQREEMMDRATFAIH